MNNRFRWRLGVCVLVVVWGANLSPAAVLWNNGGVNAALSSDNMCDSGPNTCGNSGGASWTVFDNFNVPTGATWNVTSVSFVDFLVNAPTSDIGQTTVSIWKGDPLVGGTLVGSTSGTASLSLLSGTCGGTSTCLEQFALNFSASLAGGTTYYLGAGVGLTPSFSNENTLRAFAAGGNTAPGGTSNGLARWEQSNGSISGSSWSAGSSNNVFPSGAIVETATAFTINGTVGTTSTPEPAATSLVGMALAGLVLFVRRRS